MGVSKYRGTPKSSILIGFSIINHPFWGTPILRKHPYISPIHEWLIFMGNIHMYIYPSSHGNPSWVIPPYNDATAQPRGLDISESKTQSGSNAKGPQLFQYLGLELIFLTPFTLPETNISHENPIFPGKYHQNDGFSMAMLVYRSV